MTIQRDAAVLIVGGGPAGATAGALLAQNGVPVIILEESPSPRTCLAESLLPHTLPLLDLLGVHDAVRSLPHTLVKEGTTFITGDGAHRADYWFDQALRPAIPNAYQVRRDEFDGVLLNRARELGAEVRHGWRACAPIWDGHRLTGLTVRDPDDSEHHLFARAILDATGRSAFLASRMGWRFPYSRHRKTAFAASYSPVAQPATDRQAGNTTVVVLNQGWFWIIPLAGSSATVGLVCNTADKLDRGADVDATFEELVAATPVIRHRLAGAGRLAPPLAVQNYSHRVMRMAGDGYALVGDAAGFMDPAFFSGVFTATITGASAAEDVIDALARHGRVDASDFGPTISVTRQLHRAFSALIRSFDNPHFQSLLFHPLAILSLSRGLGSVLAADLLGPGRWRRLSRFHLLRALATAQRWGVAWNRPLVPPVAQSSGLRE